MPLLDVSNLTMRFGSLAANSDVSFSVEEGTIVGLIGPNGAGKTTLFNCIAGLYRPSSGRILFGEHDITNLPSYQVARLGVARTFQVVRPLKEMTVLDNVMVGSYLRHRSPQKALGCAEECLDRCFLREWRDKPAGDLTMGNKKRLEVARALATGPRLIMLDESVAGLTSTEVRAMVSLIRSLKESGLTILMVEHIMEAIMPIADKIVVLNSGIKIAEAAPSEVVDDEQVITAYLGEKFSKRLKARKEGNGTHAQSH